jgi:hypothetical protein
VVWGWVPRFRLAGAVICDLDPGGAAGDRYRQPCRRACVDHGVGDQFADQQPGYLLAVLVRAGVGQESPGRTAALQRERRAGPELPPGCRDTRDQVQIRAHHRLLVDVLDPSAVVYCAGARRSVSRTRPGPGCSRLAARPVVPVAWLAGDTRAAARGVTASGPVAVAGTDCGRSSPEPARSGHSCWYL